MPQVIPLVSVDEYIGELVWDKGTPGLGYTIRYTHESAIVWRLGEPEKPEKALLSLVRSQVSHQNNHLKHPHEKPIAFWINCLNLPGETILDPFAGSGTTGRACKDLGRKCIMIERDEKYCEIAARRMMQEVLPL